MIATITDSIRNQPRSLQKRIGPSELGAACTHCLAAKLAGWEKRQDAAWLPFIGTAVHAELASMFEAAGGRWLVETEVMVGWVGDAEIWGSSDLFDTETGTVVDFKIVGPTTLTAAKRGPSDVYRAQLHLYGQGFVNAGHQVNDVAIAYLPRNATSLSAAIWWTEPHDPAMAASATIRADRIARQLDELAAIAPEAVGVWITGLDRDPNCYDCARFADAPKRISPLHALAG